MHRAFFESRRVRRTAVASFEPLEPRTHLAVDLGVEPVPGWSLPTNVVPGEFLQIPYRVTRTADTDDEVLNHAIDVFFSLDDVLDPSDLKVQEGPFTYGEAAFLGATPGEYEAAPLYVRVSRALTVGAQYRVLLSVRGISSLGGSDPNPSNNVAVLPQTLTVVNKFGTFGDRSGARLVLRLPDGSGSVAFSITGAGQGQVEVVDGRFAVRVTDTDADSEVSISATEIASQARPRIPLASVELAGTLSSFIATDADLFGPMTVGGAVSTIFLGDITGPTSIDLPRSINTAFNARHIRDVNLTAHSNISISAWSWQVSDRAYGTISAPKVRQLWIENFGSALPSQPGYVPPNFAGQLNVTGDYRNVFRPSVQNIKIVGVVTGGPWRVNGSISSISLGATAASFTLAAKGEVSSFNVTNSLRGLIAVNKLLNFWVGKDIVNARILVGTDLGSDASIGGVEDAADHYDAGTIGSVQVGRNIANSTIAAGRKPVGDTGVFEFVMSQYSRISSVVVGNVISANSRIHAAFYGYDLNSVTVRGVNIDWRTDQRFRINLPTPTVVFRSSRVSSTRVTFTVDFAASTAADSPLNAATAFRVTNASGQVVGRISYASIWRRDPNETSSARYVLRFTRADSRPFSAGDNGTYTMSIVPGGLTDNRGNAVPPVVLGTFTIGV